MDFGRLGLIPDGERRRVCHGLIFTACSSRHQFVWPTFLQTTEEVIRGFEAAWSYFGGVFPVVLPDNMKSIVIVAETRAADQRRLHGIRPVPRFRYRRRQSRHADRQAARRVLVHYVQHNFFAGESFVDLPDCRVRAETWCDTTAGMRIHGITQRRPLEAFRIEELPLLLPRPGAPFDTPKWSDPKVHRDFDVEVDKAIYSVPHHLVGRTLRARLDSATLKLYLRGELVKVHARKPQGGKSTDPADMPTGTEIDATRDIERLGRMAADHGPSIGLYAAAILDTPLPWTKMRQVYRLLGLVKTWGAERVELACHRALEAEALDVNLVSRMLERVEKTPIPRSFPDRS